MKRVVIMLLVFISTMVSAQNTNPFTEYIVYKIENERFSSNGEKLARKYAAKFVELYNSGKLMDVFSYDPLANTFSINMNNMPLKLKHYEWNGSSKPFKRNFWTGKLPLKTERDFNSLYAIWIIEFIKMSSNN